MVRHSSTEMAIIRAKRQSMEQISTAMNERAAELLIRQVATPITKDEWILAFFGTTDIEKVRPDAAKSFGNVEDIRHRLGEPFMFPTSFGGLNPDVGVIARSDSYKPHIPESFLTYSISQGDYSWLGEISCRAFINSPVGPSSSEYKPTEDEQLTLLSIERAFTNTSPQTIEDYTDGTEAGVLIGLEAISRFSVANPREAHNMWPRHVAEEQLRKIYEFAGPLVMTPSAIGVD